MNQRGFATLEVILMVVVIGILASVAVPRFTDVTTKANTAKIQSDLTTIDTALQIYYMEKGSLNDVTTVEKLKTDGYLMDTPTPPTGSAYMKNSSGKFESAPITVTEYGISAADNKGLKRATLDNKTVGDFSAPK